MLDRKRSHINFTITVAVLSSHVVRALPLGQVADILIRVLLVGEALVVLILVTFVLVGVSGLLHFASRHLSLEVSGLADPSVLGLVLALLNRSLKSLFGGVHLVNAFLQFGGVFKVQFY